MYKFHWERLQNVSAQIFEAVGVPPIRARYVSESLVLSNLRGVDSHGVIRIPRYIERITKGMIDPDTEIETNIKSDAITIVDGKNTLGVAVGMEALEESMKLAEKSGIGAVAAKHSNHFGAGAYFALKAIERDMIVIIMSNASQTVPPIGGIRPFLGTNPLTVGIPAGRNYPYLLDMATSVVARGKIAVAAEKNERIPEGWAVDKYGNPTTNPHEALNGSVLPFGGYKGYAISLMIDMFSGVLSGAGFGQYVKNMHKDWDTPQNIGHFFITMKIDQFMEKDLFKNRVDQYIDEIKSEPVAPNVDEILIPGEIEFVRTSQRKKEGIELPDQLVSTLNDLYSDYNIDFMEAVLKENEEI